MCAVNTPFNLKLKLFSVSKSWKWFSFILDRKKLEKKKKIKSGILNKNSSGKTTFFLWNEMQWKKEDWKKADWRMHWIEWKGIKQIKYRWKAGINFDKSNRWNDDETVKMNLYH